MLTFSRKPLDGCRSGREHGILDGCGGSTGYFDYVRSLVLNEKGRRLLAFFHLEVTGAAALRRKYMGIYCVAFQLQFPSQNKFFLGSPTPLSSMGRIVHSVLSVPRLVTVKYEAP